VVSSVIDLLLCTLFGIGAATEVTLSVESYPFVFTVCKYCVTIPPPPLARRLVSSMKMVIQLSGCCCFPTPIACRTRAKLN